MKRLLCHALLPFACLIAGCSAGTSSGIGQTISTGAAVPPPYHAYGDSITAGYTLMNPSLQAFPVLLAQTESLSLQNFAIPGDQSCDISTRQIFPNADSPSTSVKTVYSVLISTNDADIKGAGPYEAVFNLCQQAVLAWLATPIQSKILASAATVTGASHADTANGFNAVATDAAGASLTFNFSRIAAGPVYLWYRITDNNAGTFAYTLDGKVLGSVNSFTVPSISTQNGSSTSLALLRVPTVTAGSHTMILTQTSTGTSGLSVVALGVPASTRAVGSPRVLVGTTPMQYNGSGAPCNSAASPLCQAYIADITANVGLLASDALDVELFDARKYMTGTAADMNDVVHPNVVGHQEIAHALSDIY